LIHLVKEEEQAAQASWLDRDPHTSQKAARGPAGAIRPTAVSFGIWPSPG